MFREFKPGVPLRTHHIFAASIWSGVGVMLLVRGGSYLFDSGSQWLFMLALFLGTCKSLFLLDKSAGKNLNRLLQLKDGDCLGAVYSPKMWLMVLVMIILGKVLRSSGLPCEFVGILYTAIGWALLFSSRLLWGSVKKSSSSGE